MKQDERPRPTINVGEVTEEESDTPENWPQDVEYLSNHSIPSETLPQDLILHLCTSPKITHELHAAQIRKQKWICIRKITEDTPFQPAFGSDLNSHPTIGQNGLFAHRDIPPHTLVTLYLGMVHLASEEDPQSRYDAAIEADDGTRCGVDATVAGNEARFVNDYRGILNRPNLFFKDWTARSPTPSKQSSDQPDDVKSIKYPKKIKGLALYSGAHAIKTGIELCASYGKGWWAHRNS